MSKIKKIQALEILDSRGNPTIEVILKTTDGIITKAKVPSGASTGANEAIELRDNDKKRFSGKGVLKAVENVNKKIAPKLIGQDVTAQEKIDQTMIKLDGTDSKKKLGANAILSVSLASARTAAKAQKLELYEYISKTFKLENKKNTFPIPAFNIFNGGRHADTNLDFQEFIDIIQ